MLAKINSCAVVGLDCEIIEAEIDISPALPAFVIVGLPDKAVGEARERVKSAIKNTGLTFPRTKITVNLAPADLKKEGPAYDLPIALGILQASEQLMRDWSEAIFVGELALDGQLRHINGVLPIALTAQEKGFRKIYLPAVDAPEAALVSGIEVYPLTSLAEAVLVLRGEKKLAPLPSVDWSAMLKNPPATALDMAYIKGQSHAKRALEIAAAGGHNVLLTGSPGAGKTMLARALPSILPPLTQEEILEVTKIYSVAGALPRGQALITQRPFRSPHHSASAVSLIGGGSFPRPGEISLAHRGVLFLDEFSEFPRSVLEHLRQPLEDGEVTISRAQGSVTYPARFTLIASQNPCPCGWLYDPHKNCVCTPAQIARYHKKVSGPILDRIDMHLEVPPVKLDKLTSEELAERSEQIRQRVEAARARQQERFQGLSLTTNAEMSNKEIQQFCQLNEESKELLRQAIQHYHLSARSYFRLIKLARTIADLADSADIAVEHIQEALNFRPRSWGQEMAG